MIVPFDLSFENTSSGVSSLNFIDITLEYSESIAITIELEFVSDWLFRRFTVRGTINVGATFVINSPVSVNARSVAKVLFSRFSEVIVKSAE